MSPRKRACRAKPVRRTAVAPRVLVPRPLYGPAMTLAATARQHGAIAGPSRAGDEP